jgi:DNA polymerase III subunit gamma/tau
VAYQSLYRRYRPRRFADVRGQEHVVLALRNAVRDDRVGHAYLFSGPRGTGKTTNARILAKVLNCENPVDGEPCCVCQSCVAVEAGTSYDVHELDAASNNGVDAMRDLIEKASLGTPGRHKVYILDEVHMLSKAAEAALLKTLEEPPPHVVFVLATTDPQKVSETVRSRSQHLQFHLLSADTLDAHVRWLIADAGLTLGDDAIEAVLRQGGGSARDTLSALEQVLAAGGIAPEAQPVDDLIDALADADPARALAGIAAAANAGRDARTLTEQLIAQLRDAFLSLMAPELVRLPDRAAARVAEQGRRLGAATTVRAMEVLGEILVEMRHAPEPRLLLDVALVRLTNPSTDASPAALVARLERLERAVAAGGALPAVASTPDSMPEAARQPGDGRSASTAATAPSAARAKAETEPETRAAETRAATTDPPLAAATDQAARPRATLGGRAQRPAAPAQPKSPLSPAAPASDRGAAELPVSATTVPPVAAATSTSASTSTAGSTGSGPNRDQLTLAWADHVLPKLKGMAKALFAAGRFIDGGSGTATFALPTGPHRDRCEPLRPQVEAVLAAHFGTPVVLRLVVDGEEPTVGTSPLDGADDGPTASSSRPSPPPLAPSNPVDIDDDDPSADIDLNDLVDAPDDGGPSAVERVAQAFPGAKLLEDDGRL